ncbi:hypothetical protein L208DRAFT_1425713 [Tricholoma matsutake]|nr:hypothetical protein L208DRAFT_1425713 [Tricholoma matsutake 945]
MSNCKAEEECTEKEQNWASYSFCLDEEDSDEQENFSLLSELSIDAFLDAISDAEEGVSSLLACVDLSSLSVYHSKQFPTARYMYHCSQVCECQHKPKNGRHAGAKLWDKDAVDTFDCHGWLFITVTEGSNIVNVKFQHKDDHVPYWNIDLWDEVLKSDPTPAFSRKAVYHLWSNQICKTWKRDPDELKSAKILLDEASKPQLGRKGLYVVALDSAWNTNGSRFEVYALLGEIYGSGCPMGKEAGGKEHYLTEIISYFKGTWKMKAIITLTDKDLSEINAFLKVYPEAKHQLCFWYCLHAVKTRLSILRRRPKYYDVKEAMKEFDWISETFNTAPEQAPAGPHLTIRLNGIVQSIVPLPRQQRTDIETDAEDGPDWMFEEEEVKSSNPNYVFCPTPHQKQILHMFTKHFWSGGVPSTDKSKEKTLKTPLPMPSICEDFKNQIIA